MHLLSQLAEAPPPPQELVRTFDQGKLDAIGVAIHEARGEKRLPGGVLWLERQDVSFHRAYGMASTRPVSTVAQGDTIYDAASLTKVVATTPAVLLLHERGKLNVQDPVRVHLPEFTGQGREAITIRQLLTHTSGLRPDISVNGWTGHQECIAKCVVEVPRAAPDERFIYSDINFQLLDEIVRRVSGKRLDMFCTEEIFGPLKMHDTGYNPPVTKHARIAPTTVTDGKALRGVVHDPRARKTSGIAGHAGLFTTAPDLARYARMLLQTGELDGIQLFKAETVQLMTSVQTPPPCPRAAVWVGILIRAIPARAGTSSRSALSATRDSPAHRFGLIHTRRRLWCSCATVYIPPNAAPAWCRCDGPSARWQQNR